MIKLQILMNNYKSASVLCDIFPWEKMGINIVGAEYNGALGLEQLKYHKPQIIILDRTLPVIGIEKYISLICELYDNPNDFILLLIDPNTNSAEPPLRHVFMAVRFEEITPDFLSEAVRHILDIFKQRSASAHLTIDSATLAQDTKIAGDGSFTAEVLSYLCSRHSFDLRAQVSILIPRAHKSMLQSPPEALYPSVHKINQLLQQTKSGLGVLMQNGVLCILYQHAQPAGRTAQEKVLYELKYLLETQSSATFTFFLSNPVRFSSLREEYESLLQRLPYGYFISNLDFVTENEFQSNIPPASSQQESAIANQFRSLDIFHSFPSGTLSVTQQINELYIWNLKPSLSFSDLFYCRHKLELISSTLLFLHSLEDLSCDDPFSRTFETVEEECSEVKKWFHLLAEKCIDSHKTINSLILKSAAEMIDHFQDAVSLTQIASKIHVTDTYLSHLFKKETGSTFTEYLTLLKICSAKNYIRNTQKRVADIAAEVGFSDYRYFSQIFKKAVGITPTEYKGFCRSVK